MSIPILIEDRNNLAIILPQIEKRNFKKFHMFGKPPPLLSPPYEEGDTGEVLIT
jgi:hypothetical protein